MLIAVLVCVLSAQRFGNVLDYAGPNLASNQVIVYAPDGGPGGPAGPGPATGPSQRSMTATVHSIAAGLGSADVVTLESTSASLQHAAAGRSWSGAVYAATPQLLRAFGIKASEVDPAADVLSMRPGLSGVSHMQLLYGNGGVQHAVRPGQGQGGQGPGTQGPGTNSFPCPKNGCLANPVIQEVSALPSGTSAPNTVITDYAIRKFGLQTGTAGWLIQTPHPPTAAQISNARLTASAAGLSMETKNSIPASSEIINWATVFGILVALGILAMSVGLIRSETASDLRTLAATGASSTTRRSITAATAGALGLAGAVLGTLAAYIGAVAFAWDNPLDGLGELSSVPTGNLLIILIGMPLIAVVVGWLLAGREPAAIAHQPIE